MKTIIMHCRSNSTPPGAVTARYAAPPAQRIITTRSEDFRQYTLTKLNPIDYAVFEARLCGGSDCPQGS